jgi:hypothetical protein
MEIFGFVKGEGNPPPKSPLSGNIALAAVLLANEVYTAEVGAIRKALYKFLQELVTFGGFTSVNRPFREKAAKILTPPKRKW